MSGRRAPWRRLGRVARGREALDTTTMQTRVGQIIGEFPAADNAGAEQQGIGLALGVVGTGEGERMMNPDGTSNVERMSVNFWNNAYFYLVTMSWRRFILLIFFSYLILSAFFGLLYYAIQTMAFSQVLITLDKANSSNYSEELDDVAEKEYYGYRADEMRGEHKVSTLRIMTVGSSKKKEFAVDQILNLRSRGRLKGE